MKKFIILFALLFFTTINSQTTISQNSFRSTLGDSADLPAGLWYSGSNGGPVSFGVNFQDTIFFTQGTKLFKAVEGAEKIEIVKNNFLPKVARSFKIDNGNLYMIFDEYSDYKNKIAIMDMSNLNSSSATEYGGVTNGINKFEEHNGYVYLAHNKDGVLCDKIIGADILNNTLQSIVYLKDFRDFTMNDDIAYLIADNGTAMRTIEIVDFSDKSNIHKVGSIDVTSAVSVTYSNGYLYVPCEDNLGMQVIDVATPSAPVNVGNYRSGETFASYSQVIVDGIKAFLKRNNELTVLDISNPPTPTRLNSSFLDEIAGFKFTDVANGKIYYENSGHFGIIDIDVNNNINIGKKYLSPTVVQKVSSDENTLVVTDYSYFYFSSVTDNKFSPEIFKRLKIGTNPAGYSLDAKNLMVEGDYFYLDDGEYFYTHQISNLSDTPLSIYTYNGYSSAVKVSGNLAIVGGFDSSFDEYLELIDITDKTNPTQLFVGTNLTSGTVNAIDVSSDGKTLYLTSEGGGNVWFAIFDISNKTAPRKIVETNLGLWNKVTMNVSDTTSVFVTNKSNQAYLFAYDISDTSNPSILSSVRISSNKYNDAKYLEGLWLINVPQDEKIYTYTVLNDQGIFLAGDEVEVYSQLENITGFIEHTATTAPAKFSNSITRGEDTEYDYGYVYGAAESEGYKIIHFKKTKPKADPNSVELVTDVAPVEAATDGCNVAPSGGTYQKGTNVNLSATAVSGWVFTNWSGDASGSANPTEIIMDADKSVTGNFLPLLNLSMTSAPTENHDPPTSLGEELYIATANIFVDGVDWLFQGITFTANGKAKAEYTEAYLEVKGSKIKGSIAQDGDGNITSVSFTTSTTIKEGETLPVKFYYKFNIPSKLDGIYAAGDLMEVKKLSVSTSISKLNCIPIPVPARPGVKLPLQEFASNTQTMASIWNVSLSPAEPFATIQEAIDFNRTVDGNRIKITTGFYEQHDINVTKELTIFGPSGKDLTYLGFKEQEHETKIMFLKRNNIKIYGLTFQEGAYALFNEEGVNIKNCEIYLNTFINNHKGIELLSSDSSDIHDNELYTGIQIGGDGNKITQNRIGRIKEAFGREIPYEGVSIYKGNENLISENQISGCINAIQIDNSASNNGIENIIEKNKIGTNADGTAVSEVPIDRGIIIEANSNVIKNNLISGFKFDGILIKNDNSGGWNTDVGKENEILDNYIGLNIDGSSQILVALATGIRFGSGGDSNLVKNNTIASCGFALYLDEHSEGNKIIENKIGTDPLGVSIRANLSGITIRRSNNNLIKDNIISGNAVSVIFAYANTNRIEGNKIGTDITGTKYLRNIKGIAVGNESSENVFFDNTILADDVGIAFLGKKTVKNRIDNNRIGTDYLGKNKSACKVGILLFDGTKSNNIANNLISGCSEVGVAIYGKGTEKNLIQNNKIGLSLDGNSAIPNKIGIQILQAAEANIINYNYISGNKVAGISLSNKGTTKNIIKNNFIGLNGTKNGVIPNSSGIIIIDNANFNFIDRNSVAGNNFGIDIQENSDGNSIRNNFFGTNKTGTLKLGNKIAINVFKSSKNVIAKNKIWYNESGILDGSGKNIITGNDIAYNTGNTGIHLNNSKSLISGNIISNDETDAIKAEDGSQPTIINNNIFDNKGFGLVNTDDNSVVSANGNWWGSASGPGNSIFGGVHIENWLDEMSTFSVVASSDTLFVLPNAEDSLLVFCQNRNFVDDKIDITITGDKTNWLEKTSFVYDLADTNSLMAVVRFTTPASAQPGETSKYYITGKSQNDPTKTMTDSFYIFNYNSVISDLIVSPQYATLSFGDTLALSATAFDQFKKALNDSLTLSWETSTGKINSSGVFVADSTEEISKIKVTESSTGIFAFAEINIVSDSNAVNEISITPDSIQVEQNSIYQFSAIAKNRDGKEVSFKQVWSTDGGNIDSTGQFTAGNGLGKYSVTVSDAYNNNSSTVFVTIVLKTSVKSDIIVPKQYSLNQNYPNPFNPSTTISYGLPFESKVKVEIFNILGQRVDVITNRIESAGLHSTIWEAGHLASGIYIIRINATSVSTNANFTKTIKMLLIK